jgi:hypothetical protein
MGPAREMLLRKLKKTRVAVLVGVHYYMYSVVVSHC